MGRHLSFEWTADGARQSLGVGLGTVRDAFRELAGRVEVVADVLASHRYRTRPACLRAGSSGIQELVILNSDP